MKAQLSIEYFVSMILFVMFVAYIIFQLMTFTPNYLNEIKTESLRSEAYQISELLVNDPGEPANWQTVADSSIKRLGLLDDSRNKTNLLSKTKVDALRSKCGNYENVKKWVDTENQFSLLIVDKTGIVGTVDCRPTAITTRAINTTIRRVVAFDSGGYGELILHVW